MAYRGRCKDLSSCDFCEAPATKMFFSEGGVRADVCPEHQAHLSTGEKLTDKWGFVFQLVDGRLHCRHTKQEE